MSLRFNKGVCVYMFFVSMKRGSTYSKILGRGGNHCPLVHLLPKLPSVYRVNVFHSYLYILFQVNVTLKDHRAKMETGLTTIQILRTP